MTNKFHAYYQEEIKKAGGIHSYITKKASEKKPFLNRIRKYAQNKKVLEAGCGSAANSLYLANTGFSVTALDKDATMLAFAQENAQQLTKKPSFLQKDILDTDYPKNSFDVAFSHGVLEHFQDDQIIQLINAQLAIARYVVISVPSDFFTPEQAINGDERFLSQQHWKHLITQTKGKLIESFGYFYESQELKIRLQRTVAKYTFNLLPFKKPYIGFVIRGI